MEWINYFIIEDINDLIIREEEDNIIFFDPLLYIIYTDSIQSNIGKSRSYEKAN